VPQSLPQFNPSQYSQLGMDMSDDALVTFGAPVGPGEVSFHDTGFMPVNQLTLGNLTLPSPSGLGGLFISYSGDGVQNFSANGAPTSANYTDLHYQLIGYTGDATFSHAADGTPTLSGVSTEVVLAQGDLIAGHLAFGATGNISGEVDTTMQVGGVNVGDLDISVQHSASDIGHTATGGLTLSAGALHATYVPMG